MSRTLLSCAAWQNRCTDPVARLAKPVTLLRESYTATRNRHFPAVCQPCPNEAVILCAQGHGIIC